MRDFFQEQLNELKQELTIMGSFCEEIIALASHALTNMDEELVRKVAAIGAQIGTGERSVLITGCVVSLLVSLLVIRVLMDFVRKRSFAPFGVYRIALGAAVLAYFLLK